MTKDVKLLKLKLTNYRNIESLELCFDGKDSAIVGENHVGKTNALEAIHVLLCDQLINGSSDLASIKPLSDAKKNVSIEATFSIDGDPFDVRKDYGEDWVKSRGSDELTMKGHYQKLFIQGTRIERTSEFYAKIRESFGIPSNDCDKIDYIRMLISPNYLGDMGEGKDWTALRAFIVKLVGDVDDDDVFDANQNLAIIKSDLKAQRGSLDGLKKKLKQEADGLKETILGKEAIIANMEKTVKPSGESVAIAKKAIEEAEAEISMLRACSGSDAKSERLERELSDLRKCLIEAKEKAMADYLDPTEGKRKEIDDAYSNERSEFNRLVLERSEKLGKKRAAEIEIERLQSEREAVGEDANDAMVSRIREIDATEISVEENCPTCGQALPPEKVENAKSEAKERLKAEKASLIAKCRANKSKRSEIDEALVEEKTKIAYLEDELDETNAKIDESKAKMEELTERANSLPKASGRSETQAEAFIRLKIEAKEAELAESKAEFQSGMRDTAKSIAERQESETPFRKTLDDLAYWERQSASAERERNALQSLRKDLAFAEQKRECASQFLLAKLRMIDENVAKVFGKIKIKMIKDNINGGFDPVCKPYIYDTEKGESTGVSWASGSKSERVETGIAIMEAIKEAKGLPDLPILFDEGGEISTETMETRLKTKSQIVCVKVRDGIPFPAALPIR